MGMGGLSDGLDDDEFGDDGFSEINITPLTDVFLVMLIIFFLAAVISIKDEKKRSDRLKQEKDEVSEALAKSKELNINLPAGGVAGTSSPQDKLIISMDNKGALFAAGQPVTPEQLRVKLQKTYIANPKTQISIQADKGVAHGSVVTILDMAHQENLTQIVIATN